MTCNDSDRSNLLTGIDNIHIIRNHMPRRRVFHLIILLIIIAFIGLTTHWIVTQADVCTWQNCQIRVILNETINDGTERTDIAVDSVDVVNISDWKKVGVVHSVVGKKCRRNTGILIQRMRSTQRTINKMLNKYVANVTERYLAFPHFFGPAMNGFRYALRPFKYYSQDEYKFFLEFADPKSNCNHMTFGVGGSWDGEKALRQKYPQCRMTGVDPSAGLSQKAVESDPNSRFINTAVSDQRREFTGGMKQADGSFNKRQKMQTRGFVELLMVENEGRTVDFMTIDVEGAEYALLRELHKKRNELPVICQINVEIHMAEEFYGVKLAELDAVLREMMDEAHFVLLNVETRFTKYNQIFLLNVGDDECIQKFLC